ncbi:alanyl-tRNA editing protein [Myxococcota bacterium]|nr:alanyl-tRNA editing protein [Myxococcota bacterium]
MATELLCRTDSYARQVIAQVVGCVEARGSWEVVLDRTVLYPGGGGQPADGGSVGGRRVIGIRAAHDGGMVHLLDGPVSGSVAVEVDWAGRFDNMQQHTAQHLLTALAGARLGFKTIAFHMNPELCDIEFEMDSVERTDLIRLENLANDAVLDDRPVSISFVTREQMSEMNVRSRLLPEGLTGPFRLVEIDGIDINTCGGTHVSSTGQVQVIKILGAEKLTRGVRVFYAAGGRVRRLMEGLLEREAAVGAALTTGPADFLSSITALQNGLRDSQAACRLLRSRLAGMIVGDMVSMADAEGVAVWHGDEPDSEFLRQLAERFRQERPDSLLLLTGGVTSGVFVVAGPDDLVQVAGQAAARAMDGRGGGRGGIFQGKAGTLSLWSDALARIREVAALPRESR